MRNPLNNPTDRILRLLSEYDDLKSAYNRLLEIATTRLPMSDFQSLPIPVHTEFEKELQRQGGQYTRLRASILSKRSTMQRRRLQAQDSRAEPSIGTDPVPELSTNEISKMIKDIK